MTKAPISILDKPVTERELRVIPLRPGSKAIS